MVCQTLLCAGIVFVAVETASAQSAAARAAGMPDFNKKSSERVIFFTGKVMLDNGSAPADPVRIERVCDGRATFQAWTDEKGGFSFKVSSSSGDVSMDDASLTSNQAPDMNKPMNASASQYTAPITSGLKGCEIQAVLPGYGSERVRIDIKSIMDDARVGTIILHPQSRASALTVSATSLAAPSSAKKAYEKGLEAAHEEKWDAAVNEFAKAVKIYPRFAVAWYQLGLARQSKGDVAGAQEAWKQALNSDPKYVRPYESLAAMADRQGDWAESEKYSRLWIQLDAEDFPAAYLLNAVANARLRKPDEAEHAVREGLRTDKDQKLPRLQYVLGLILMEKKQYTESARCFHKYLELAPNAVDASIVRQQLPGIEERAAAPPPK